MRNILPEWVIEKKLKEIEAEEKFCKENNINPRDYDYEFEIETVRFVRWHIFWVRKIIEWKPFYGTWYEFIKQKGRKRWKFKCMTEWRTIDEDDKSERSR